MRNPRLRNLILAALFAALTAVVAQYKFFLPGVPGVPVTLQVLVVFLAGGLLGPVAGAVAMLLYVLLGAVGLPVYAGGASGMQVLLGPTGGYLFSYPLAAAVIGLLAPAYRAPRLWRTGAAMLAGLIIIYAGGAGWAVLLGGKAFAAVLNGWVLPFVPFDIAKLALATSLATAVNRALVAQGYWGRQAA
jgi:biotin transport system substrate-specific component